ncbi:MAG: SMC-Scp complex subunit ScpB [Candidatus Omnitrophica bacterium]|nr:SMC-Scp complex subunit ScpB [Candidatus Omnitrophota bacterium]
MEQGELKKILESFLFVSSSPVQIAQVKTLFGVEDKIIENAFEELIAKYASSDGALRIIKVAEGYRFSTAPEVAPHIKKFFKDQRPRLSRASLETLSIVAYKQPVTRNDVEFIRGVNVEGALGTLLERGLIRIAGRKDAPGRPILYGTTRLFLEHFGLNTLKDLPLLNEFNENDLNETEKASIDNNTTDSVVEPKDLRRR